MKGKKLLLLGVLIVAVCASVPALAQGASASSKSKNAQGSARASYTMKAYSRMVTLDVVVENKKGHHIRGLKASDFQIYEQTPYQSKKKYRQKIAHLSEIHTAALKPPMEAPADAVPGVYTNVVKVQKNPVPPTVLLVDGVNTQVQYQAQVHVQMLKMLRQLPANVPVAVVLMGVRVRVLQGFTTDHTLVQKALAKAVSATGFGWKNPADDPDSPGNLLASLASSSGGNNASLAAMARDFDKVMYGVTVQWRVDRTCDVFMSIARSLEGYPGRKNVLWLSTSFPMVVNPFMDVNSVANRDFQRRIKELTSALDKAKVAVYPVDVGGVRTLLAYTAATRPANEYAGSATTIDGLRVSGAASRQIETWYKDQSTMLKMAKDTGGKVCIGNNNLAKCVAKAVHDSSDFYEISYYSNSIYWNGEYRKIFVTVDRHRALLSYRRGYFATPEVSPDPKAQAAAMRKDCGNLLNATGIAFTAKTVPSKTPGRLTYRLLIDPSELTFVQGSHGEQRVKVMVGVCTYNHRGWSQKMMTYPLNLSLNATDYHALMAGGHVIDAIYVPEPKPSAVRLLVKDVPSGKLGSVYIQTGESR